MSDARFRDLPQFLSPGDLLVVNTSATLPAALDGHVGKRPVELRLSTPVAGQIWVVELRTEAGSPFRRPRAGTRLTLPGGASGELLAAYAGSERRQPRGLPAPARPPDPIRLRPRAVAD